MPKTYINVEAMNEQDFIAYFSRDSLSGNTAIVANRDVLSTTELGNIVNSGEFTNQQQGEYYSSLANSLPMKNGEVDVAKLGNMVNSGNASEYQKSEYRRIIHKMMQDR